MNTLRFSPLFYYFSEKSQESAVVKTVILKSDQPGLNLPVFTLLGTLLYQVIALYLKVLVEVKVSLNLMFPTAAFLVW